MLNFMLKTRQNRLCCVHMPRQRSQKAHTLTTTSSNGCRAFCPRSTETASCKGRGMQPSTAGFQLVENTWNYFNQSSLLMHNHVLPHTNGAAISEQRLEFENHLLSAINAQRCHALKPNKHTNCPWGPTYRRIKRRQDADYHKLFAQSSWYLLWLPRHARPKPNPPS